MADWVLTFNSKYFKGFPEISWFRIILRTYLLRPLSGENNPAPIHLWWKEIALKRNKYYNYFVQNFRLSPCNVILSMKVSWAKVLKMVMLKKLPTHHPPPTTHSVNLRGIAQAKYVKTNLMISLLIWLWFYGFFKQTSINKFQFKVLYGIVALFSVLKAFQDIFKFVFSPSKKTIVLFALLKALY